MGAETGQVPGGSRAALRCTGNAPAQSHAAAPPANRTLPPSPAASGQLFGGDQRVHLRAAMCWGPTACQLLGPAPWLSRHHHGHGARGPTERSLWPGSTASRRRSGSERHTQGAGPEGKAVKHLQALHRGYHHRGYQPHAALLPEEGHRESWGLGAHLPLSFQGPRRDCTWSRVCAGAPLVAANRRLRERAEDTQGLLRHRRVLSSSTPPLGRRTRL